MDSINGGLVPTKTIIGTTRAPIPATAQTNRRTMII